MSENVIKLTTVENWHVYEMAHSLGLSVNKNTLSDAFHAGDRGSNPLGDAKVYGGLAPSMLTPLLTLFLRCNSIPITPHKKY